MKSIYPVLILTTLIMLFSCGVDTKEQSSPIVMPKNLIGVSLEYKYEGGNGYHVKMETSGLYYQFKTGSKPDKWWGPFDYNVLKTERGDYVIGWYEEGYGDYITLTVDFDKKTLIGSGIVMPNSYIHFQRAKIKSFTVKGKKY